MASGKIKIEKGTMGQLVAWCLYDFATSAYFSVIITFVFASYFIREIAPNEIIGTQLWGYTISASALFIAIVSPCVGAFADLGGYHKRWLRFFTYMGVIVTACLWFAYPTEHSIHLVLLCIFIGNFSLEVSAVFYNAYLPQLAPPNYLGRVSGWAWGCGYVGGIICLMLSFFIFVKGDMGGWLAKDTFANIRAVTLLVAAWIFIFSLPLFLIVPQRGGIRPLSKLAAVREVRGETERRTGVYTLVHEDSITVSTKQCSTAVEFRKRSNQLSLKHMVIRGWRELAITIKHLPNQRDLMFFFIARMLYMDGLSTLFALGGIYATGTFALSLNDVLLFGIIMNITAGFGAATFAWLDDKIGSKKTILAALIGLTLTYTALLLIHSLSLFWVFTPILGLFVGPVQAVSRTFLSRLAKPEEITRMYGLFNLSGKATSFLGPLLVGTITVLTGTQRLGMAMIIPFFILGGILLCFVKDVGRQPPFATSLDLFRNSLP